LISKVASENLKDAMTKTPLTFCRVAYTAMMNHGSIIRRPFA